MKQKETFIDLMEDNFYALYGQHPSVEGKDTKKEIWLNVEKTLNELGPPTKTWLQWKRVIFFLIVF